MYPPTDRHLVLVLGKSHLAPQPNNSMMVSQPAKMNNCRTHLLGSQIRARPLWDPKNFGVKFGHLINVSDFLKLALWFCVAIDV